MSVHKSVFTVWLNWQFIFLDWCDLWPLFTCWTMIVMPYIYILYWLIIASVIFHSLINKLNWIIVKCVKINDNKWKCKFLLYYKEKCFYMKCLHVCCEKVINDCMSSEFIYLLSVERAEILTFLEISIQNVENWRKMFFYKCVLELVLYTFFRNQIIYLICCELTELLMTSLFSTI